MKNPERINCLLLAVFFLFPFIGYGQEIPAGMEQQLENQTATEQAESEDDSPLQELEQFRKNPININAADANELKQLRIVTDLQIANLVAYRNLLGNLVSIYELQAIPSWDLGTIRKLVPFITVTMPVSLKEDAAKRFRDGEHSLLLRVAQVLERSAGANYLGSPQKIFLRYRYSYKNLLQFGFSGEKDAGEQFGKGAQNKGFDFYSFHFFARKTGIIQSLAVGDFIVNMGQGLVQWQGLAFKKSVEVMSIKRQSAVLRPYSAAGEFYFHRGAGITLKKRNLEATVFVSMRKLGGNIVADSIHNGHFISSFLTSGYHRTASENADRNNITQMSFGGNAIYRASRWQVGVNGIFYTFSLPLQKKDEPYNLYAVSGKKWYNFSIDYSYTWKNLHFFGEAAADKHFHKAFINGLLISVDPAVDLSFLQRTISKAFQSVNGNAFTENVYPTNETGFYAGISIRPLPGWRVDAYADTYHFTWLKYQVDAPSQGKDFMVQLSYTPGKQAELYSRFRNETKQSNSQDPAVSNSLEAVPRKSWRTQFSYRINPFITLRNRVELLWYDNKGEGRENGFLAFVDFTWKPFPSAWSGMLRLQYFETDSYDSRVYAYENDVLYSYSIPSFADKGTRYYLLLNYDMNKKISFWLRIAQTIYPYKPIFGSGTDESGGNRRTEIKLQTRVIL